ncbi:uncharacterized protein K460DRAFT_359920 [Cucurbitaria berberidis CBS 394.84]|uniref:Uncharacterized protein n=1 Tax=Cucurbitaria berberidis CBS 394.84 TaxID=1168544 RepID=A0A9P4G706_9PLEO|nr:uncharacterized protein K460DRAFT_359920 [Cucurbitaria berberidis CBS 394.84]KAF1840213.1 hypothetical protein K460DRAFT_359920 [Cucurbitaria berberidis CBS 394.84]
MRLSTFSLSAVLLAIGTASAQNATVTANSTATPTTTITVAPGCPSATPADVMVNRSAVAVPSCDAGNATKPVIVSSAGSGSNTTTPTGAGAGGASATGTGSPSQFTGAAGKVASQGAIVVIGGVIAGLML